MTAANEIEIADERALAANFYPEEWAVALIITGKRGNHRRAELRKRAIADAIMIPLRNAGASCSNCSSRLRNPGMMKGLFCDLDSDLHGYMETRPDALCSRWSA